MTSIMGPVPFTGFPKIPRLSREIIITEKIDGTNASVYIEPWDEGLVQPFEDSFSLLVGPGEAYRVWVGSRTRWLMPGRGDNYGFAGWVQEHLEDVVKLGPGRHFGEWWGKGIQRNYGLADRRFSLFNTSRWGHPDNRPANIDVVPVIYKGVFTTYAVEIALNTLRTQGSLAAPGFMKPEGVVIFHTAGNFMMKKTLEGDDEPKSKVHNDQQSRSAGDGDDANSSQGQSVELPTSKGAML